MPNPQGAKGCREGRGRKASDGDVRGRNESCRVVAEIGDTEQHVKGGKGRSDQMDVVIQRATPNRGATHEQESGHNEPELLQQKILLGTRTDAFDGTCIWSTKDRPKVTGHAVSTKTVACPTLLA